MDYRYNFYNFLRQFRYTNQPSEALRQTIHWSGKKRAKDDIPAFFHHNSRIGFS